MSENVSEYISVEEAAKQIHLHPDSIRRFIRNKELPAYKFHGVYRIKRTEFEEFIKRHSTIDEKK